jgi:DNA-binding response OmpR family regulator
MDNQFEGLKAGADVYIEKPFFPHILEQNILEMQDLELSLDEIDKQESKEIQARPYSRPLWFIRFICKFSV